MPKSASEITSVPSRILESNAVFSFFGAGFMSARLSWLLAFMRNRSKVVAAFLNGSRLKGFLYDFSSLRGYLFLFPQNEPAPGDSRQAEEQPQSVAGLLVRLADLKALFFVKEFAGNAISRERGSRSSAVGEKHVEVVFADGETSIGLAESADAGSLGFFLVPSSPQSNNERIFVVSANVREVRPVHAVSAAQHA